MTTGRLHWFDVVDLEDIGVGDKVDGEAAIVGNALHCLKTGSHCPPLLGSGVSKGRFYAGIIMSISAALLFVFVEAEASIPPAITMGIVGIGLIASSNMKLL